MKQILYFALLLLALLPAGCQKNKTAVTALKVEMQENPEGVATANPRFSWQITSGTPDLVQQSYQIEVARTEDDLEEGHNLIWDSGVVESDQSLLIPYEGGDLLSRGAYYWRVKVTCNHGETAWSDTHHWSMALLNKSEWQAAWIGEDALSNPGETASGNTRLAARYLRKPFTTKKGIKRAMLYISGLGSYEAWLNGERVSEDVFAPMVSWYPERVYYNVYDVTPLLQKNENLLGVKLGNGRFFGMRGGDTQMFGLPRLLAQLEIEYSDGSTDMIVSDNSWRVTSKGPIIANNEFDGEEYDARLAMEGWNRSDFDERNWVEADIMDAPAGELTAQIGRAHV